MENIWPFSIAAGLVLGGILIAVDIFTVDFIPKLFAKKRIKEGRYCKTCAYYDKHTGYCMSPKLYKEFDPELGERVRSKVSAMRNYNTWNCRWKEREGWR